MGTTSTIWWANFWIERPEQRNRRDKIRLFRCNALLQLVDWNDLKSDLLKDTTQMGSLKRQSKAIHPSTFGVHVKLGEDLWVFIRGILTEYLLILIVVNSSMIINLNVYTRTFFLFSSSTWLIGLEKKSITFYEGQRWNVNWEGSFWEGIFNAAASNVHVALGFLSCTQSTHYPPGVLLSMSMESVHVFVIHHTSEVHTSQYILNSGWKPYL